MSSSALEKRQAKRAELVRRLAELSPGKRADALLDEVDGRVVVKSIPAEDVYGVILDTGLADCTEIVQLSTPDQFRTYLDLAAWSRDRLDPLEVLRWLRAARGDDDDAYLAKLRGLDMEILELVYKRLTRIHDLEEDPDANPPGVYMETPEGKYLLEFLVDGVDEAAIRRLTNDLITQNPFELARFLEAVRFEMVTELEETAYQFRQSRLQDLGFPPVDEAVKLFAWIDPAKVGPQLSASVALTAGSFDFVEAAFKGLDAHERSILQAEVRYLVNSALVAEGAEPGDPREIRRVSEHARDYLNLGLEHLCGGDATQAVEVVRDQTLKRAFQIGFSLTLRLRRLVERMAAEPGAKFAETWWALDEETAALTALVRRRPLKALKVPGAEPVPFRSRRELIESEALLQRVRGQRAIFAALLDGSPADVAARFGGVTLAELTPQRLFLAALARSEVGSEPMAAPFPALKLIELGERLFEVDGKLRASAGQKFLARFPADDAKVMVERGLAALHAELSATWVKDNRFDVKKLAALIVEGELPL